MKANEVILLALVVVVTILVIDMWARQRADEEVRAILAGRANTPDAPKLVITGFASGAISA